MYLSSFSDYELRKLIRQAEEELEERTAKGTEK